MNSSSEEEKYPQSRPLKVGLISRAGSFGLSVSHIHTHTKQYGLRPGKQHCWSSSLSNLKLIAVGPLCVTSEIRVWRRVWRLGLRLAPGACDYASVRVRQRRIVRVHTCTCACMSLSQGLCGASKYVRARMWFLARVSAEIGLPVGAVCRESGKAKGKL